MPDRTALPRLYDIPRAIEGISGTVTGISYETYIDTWHLRAAVERGIEIISEASRHIPSEMKARSPEIPWQKIASIGNVIRHGYAHVDDSIIWNVVTEHLAQLEKVVRSLMTELEERT
jgi:uncharacterized protein with HEPN domain